MKSKACICMHITIYFFAGRRKYETHQLIIAHFVSFFCTDDVDVIGYNSDSDERSGSEMTGSDGGLAVSTKEIVITEQSL